MQIRVANRQDEPAIRHIVEEAYASHKRLMDPAGADRDLNNIEASYYWRNGLFLVAEENDQVIGLLGAVPATTAEHLEIMRLAVAGNQSFSAVAAQLVDRCIFFALNAECSRVYLSPVQLMLDPKHPVAPLAVTTDPSMWMAALG